MKVLSRFKLHFLSDDRIALNTVQYVIPENDSSKKARPAKLKIDVRQCVEFNKNAICKRRAGKTADGTPAALLRAAGSACRPITPSTVRWFPVLTGS